MRASFGGLIALILLGLYVYLVQLAIAVVHCVALDGCFKYTERDFNDGMAQAMSIIGGLVSALVIAELAVTRPGEAPGARLLDENPTPRATLILKIITVNYVLVWVVTGLWAFLVGLDHPKELPALTNVGQAWFGLAVAAAYAYFGLKPR